MPNKNITNYLKQNKDKFSKEALIEELRKAGYEEREIDKGVRRVYKKNFIKIWKIKLNKLRLIIAASIPMAYVIMYAVYFLIDIINSDILVYLLMPLSILLALFLVFLDVFSFGFYLQSMILISEVSLIIHLFLAVVFYFMLSPWQKVFYKLHSFIKRKEIVRFVLFLMIVISFLASANFILRSYGKYEHGDCSEVADYPKSSFLDPLGYFRDKDIPITFSSTSNDINNNGGLSTCTSGLRITVIRPHYLFYPLTYFFIINILVYYLYLIIKFRK